MKKTIKLNNEQIQILSTLLSLHEVKDRSENRRRFKFLKVMEEVKDNYEEELDRLKSIEAKFGGDILKTVKTLSEKTFEFTYEDIEIFATGKDLFEKSFKTGHKNRTPQGIISSPLFGRAAKVYVEVEDAFMNVREEK